MTRETFITLNQSRDRLDEFDKIRPPLTKLVRLDLVFHLYACHDRPSPAVNYFSPNNLRDMITDPEELTTSIQEINPDGRETIAMHLQAVKSKKRTFAEINADTLKNVPNDEARRILSEFFSSR